jgi:hypothetical protein
MRALMSVKSWSKEEKATRLGGAFDRISRWIRLGAFAPIQQAK